VTGDSKKGIGKKILDFRLELTKTIQNPKSKIQNKKVQSPVVIKYVETRI
jgi:hypothetical protein